MNLMDNRSWLKGLAALALGVVCLGPSLRAQDQVQASGQPARALRLSYVDGQVRLAQGNQVLADQAVANTPLFEGMQLTTAVDGKAEIQFEDGSVARISPESTLSLQVLRGSGASADAQLVLSDGLAYFEFQGGGQAGQTKVRFGNTTVSTSGFTVLRVDVDNPPGKLAVFSGNAHIETGGGASVDLRGGESVTLNASDPSHYDVAESVEPDSWDAWNSDRDQELTTEAAAQTGAPTNLGQSQNPAWSDLDANGNWYDVPGQGYVWSPYDAANSGFDPYGNGSWMWTPGYGYLWASGYSWGYLPFQCGAWNFYDGFGWGWLPGSGGCSPWWGMGLYGGPNIGYAPPGYRTIPRPILQRHPIDSRPVAVIAVNHPQMVHSSAFPVRNRNTQVTIAGNAVRPLQPLPGRQTPTHSFTPPTMSTGARTSGGQGPASSRPSYGGSFSRPTGGEPFGGNGQPNSPGSFNRGSGSAPPSSAGPGQGNRPLGGANSGGSPRGGGGFSNGGGNNSRPAGNGGGFSGGNNSGGGSPHPSGGGSGGGGASPHPSGGGGGGGGGMSGGGGGSHGGGGGGGMSGGGGGGGGSHGGGGGGGGASSGASGHH